MAIVALTLPAASVVAKSPWDVEVTPPDPATYAKDPKWIASQATALAQRSALQRQLRTPEARQRRHRSETAYTSVSRNEATELAQQTFPELLTAPVDGLGLPNGVQLEEFLSPDVARVTNSQGKSSLVLASGPIAAPDDNGRLAPIDLSLSTEQGRLVPENPGVHVGLPDSAGDALRLPGKDIGIAAEGAKDVTGQVQDDRVFYPEIATDTDYVAMARPDGAQVMWQLRSPLASESPSLHLDLPAGAQARLTSALTGAPSGTNPSVEIVRDGAILSTIKAPIAADADGTNVPASYRLDGDTLIVDVPHRGKDVHYPILVDPEVYEIWGGSDWDNFGKGPCNCMMAGLWGLTTNGSGFAPYNATLAGRGLFIGSVPGFYYQGQYAQFTWGVPNYVTIYSARFDGLYHVTQGDHLFYGTYGAGRWTWVNNIGGDYDTTGASLATPDRYENMAMAVLGVYEDQTVQHPIWGWAGVRGMVVRVGEASPPGVRLDRLDTSAGVNAINQGKWLSSAETLTARVVGGDVGLGLQHVGIMSMTNNWINGAAWHSGCTGNRAAPCPLNVTWDGTLPLAGLDGYVPMKTTAVDVVDNAGYGPSWTLKVDGNNPFVGFGGEAWDHKSDGTLGFNPTLRVFATDGDASHPSSGVRVVGLSLDGQSIGSWTNPAGGCANGAPSCSITQDITLPITTPGKHIIQASTYDYVGRPAQTDPIEITVPSQYPTSYNYGGGDRSVNTDEEARAVTNAQNVASDGGTRLWNGLSPADRSRYPELNPSYDAAAALEAIDDFTGGTSGGFNPTAAASAAEPGYLSLKAVGCSLYHNGLTFAAPKQYWVGDLSIFGCSAQVKILHVGWDFVDINNNLIRHYNNNNYGVVARVKTAPQFDGLVYQATLRKIHKGTSSEARVHSLKICIEAIPWGYPGAQKGRGCNTITRKLTA